MNDCKKLCYFELSDRIRKLLKEGVFVILSGAKYLDLLVAGVVSE